MSKQDNFIHNMPCEICGNTKIIEVITKNGSFMTCEKCHISTDIGRTAKEASFYWNAVMTSARTAVEG